ncbi:hypothetical protein ACS0TY_010499 [Phlomoides rotata]
MRNILFLYPDGHQELTVPSEPPLPSSSLYPHEFSMLLSVIPVDRSAFDVATVWLIFGLLLLCLLSFSSIFYLRLRSRQFQPLENFNSVWSVRLLLVVFPLVWAVNEFLRLPLMQHYLYPSSTLEEQANMCKVHVVLSLGFLEPSFLVTLLFLVKFSIKATKPSRMWPELASSLLICSSITLLQIIVVFVSPWESKMPKLMHGSSVIAGYAGVLGNEMVFCTYPFFSGAIFGGFTIGYAMVFLLSFWKVMELVINKGTRHRIYMLATAVTVALSVQIVCLSLSWLWTPEEAEYGLVVFAMFVFVAGSMAVGEVVLVLKPIKDALAVGGGGLESQCL